MTELKLTYFDFSGSRGEEVRIALRLAGVPFVDNRLSYEAFSKLRPDLPFGSMPVLEIADHGTLSQTNAILRLIGRKHGLHPENPIEAARHDEIMGAVEDLRHRISCTMRIKDADQKKAARLDLAAGYVPHWGSGVEQLIKASPFLSGERPNVADIKLYMAHKWITGGGVDDIPKETFAPFVKLASLADAIRVLPAISN